MAKLEGEDDQVAQWIRGKANQRQMDEINEGVFENCSRDIEELVTMGVIKKEEVGGRSTSYRLKIVPKKT